MNPIWWLPLLAVLWGEPPCARPLCSCIPSPGPQEALAKADAVFMGTVIAARDTLLTVAPHGQYTQRMYTLAVSDAWKGIASDTVHVFTGLGGGDCGMSFERGASYLVYAYNGYFGMKHALGTSICTRSAPADEAGEDIRAHGPPARSWPHNRPSRVRSSD